jgi:hypothetical protein
MPPQQITYTVEIDWDRDGAFSGYDDVSAYLMRDGVRISLGMDDLLTARIANVGSCEFTLLNSDRRFSPANPSSPYAASGWTRLPVRVSATHLGATHTLFRGYTKSFTPASGLVANPSCRVLCEDLLGVLQGHEIRLPVMRDQRSDQLVRHVVNEALSAPVATGRFDFTANPANNDTVTVAGLTYTFKTAISTANHVLIGATVYETIRNLVAAINGLEGSGTLYDSSSSRPRTVTASVSDSYYEITRRAAPLRWYRLGETSGTSAADIGENGRAATYTGSTLNQTGSLSGDPDKAILHDGINDKIEMPVIDLTSRSFSVELWLKPTSLASVMLAWFFYFGTGTGQQAYLQTGTSGEVNAGIEGGIVGSAGGVISVGTWAHTVMSYDYKTQTVSFYVNGTLIGTASSAGMTAQSTFMKIDETFAGYLDECLLWDRPLTAAEITVRYAARTMSIGVMITAKLRGAAGNSETISKSSTAISVTGATLSGGTDYPTGLITTDTGKETFAIAGDSWESTNAMSALGDIVNSEIGALWLSKSGTIIFKNRDWQFTRPAASIALILSGEPYAEGDTEDLYNAVRITATPRQTLASGVVARANSVVEVRPRKDAEQSGEPGANKLRSNPTDARSDYVTTISLKYVDPGTGKISGADELVLPPAPATDYTAFDTPSGSGFDYTLNGHLSFGVVAKGSGIEVDAQTRTTGSLFLRTFQIRAHQIIVAYDPVEIVRENASSVAIYGRRLLSYALPLPTSAQLAESLANYLLSRYRLPAFRVKKVDFDKQIKIGLFSLLSLEIGDVLKITDSALGMTDKKYLIVGLDITISMMDKVTVQARVFRLDDETYGVYDDATYGKYDTTARFTI